MTNAESALSIRELNQAAIAGFGAKIGCMLHNWTPMHKLITGHESLSSYLAAEVDRCSLEWEGISESPCDDWSAPEYHLTNSRLMSREEFVEVYGHGS